MAYQNWILATLLRDLELGTSVAEEDGLLQHARVDTSALTDLLADRVDLVPGTKGSGKSALFRIFVEFLPDYMLTQRKVVVAHGVQAHGDPVFHAFKDQFESLSEEEFVSFWCIYLVSLAHEQFIRGPRYEQYLHAAGSEIERFRRACERARIPEITTSRSLRQVIEWAIHVVRSWSPRPTVKYAPPGDSGEFTLDLFGTPQPAERAPATSGAQQELPKYVNDIKVSLEAVLAKADLSLWLMVDKLDEIFPRRTETERKALRGLLRAMGYFASGSIRVKVFLRDDILEQVVQTKDGFTALTHVRAREAATLRWTPEQIRDVIVKRLFANTGLANYLQVDRDQCNASVEYRAQCFSRVFPPTVYRLPKQSPTLRWICNRCADGRGVVTPRDVLDLLIAAKRQQQDACTADPRGTSEWIIGASAIQYGHARLSERRRDDYLRAEFPHLWPDIEKFMGKKAEYSEVALQGMLGKEWKPIVDNLVAIGFLSEATAGKRVYTIPFLYRYGMKVTQGKA